MHHQVGAYFTQRWFTSPCWLRLKNGVSYDDFTYNTHLTASGKHHEQKTCRWRGHGQQQ